MRRALSCLPLALLLIANVVPSKAQSAGVETTAAPAEAAGAGGAAGAAAAGVEEDSGAGGTLLYYDLNRNATFNCTLANPTKLPYVWSKNDTAITELPELKERHRLLEGGAVLELPRALEDDWGNYSCAVGAAQLAWRLHARVYTRLPSANTNVVEGQKLKLVCKVVGRPAPPVEWRYNESSTESVLAAEALGADRVTLRDSEAGVRGGELVVEAARRADAGLYVCVPLARAAGVAAAVPLGHTTLRVKDMYAALWPFLGICAEVLVLCAVILVYEKRRTKPELDDSDTDNHDQKKS